jgi:hypothetical protein
MAYQSEQHEILSAMETYGGSFVKQLVKLFILADYENQAKLEAAFQNYFQQYDEMAVTIKKQQHHHLRPKGTSE